ncbi:MAG: DUF5004 domain-containing protein [Chitinophagaceae bacterium]|nr:DUF5004 domain-containing protein [Chitinophagaceae bacterium]
MKSIFKIATIPLFAIIVLAGCKPESIRDLGIQRDYLESLNGTWKLTKATQVDEDAAKKGFPFSQLDITGLFPYTDFVFKLDVSAGAPTTFSSTPGASPKIVKLVSGTWTVDNLQYPKNIYLKSGLAADTVSLGGYPVGASATLQLKKEKKDASTGKLLISYSYEFTKQ